MIENSAQLLSAILDVGEIMLKAGAEVNRVENTIQHMGEAYGYSKIDVLTITSSIVVTMHEPDGNIETQTRRITAYETDMRKVERCNALSRAVCKELLPLSALEAEISDIRQEKRYPDWLVFLTYGFSSAVFSAFFGGSVRDMAAAFLGGLLIRCVQLVGRRLKVQNLILIIICAATAEFVTLIFVYIGLGASADRIMMGNIMLLIPGLALTTSLRDMISGDLISGLLGLCEAVIRAVAIAFGVALVLWQTGGVL